MVHQLSGMPRVQQNSPLFLPNVWHLAEATEILCAKEILSILLEVLTSFFTTHIQPRRSISSVFVASHHAPHTEATEHSQTHLLMPVHINSLFCLSFLFLPGFIYFHYCLVPYCLEKYLKWLSGLFGNNNNNERLSGLKLDMENIMHFSCL